MKLLEGKTAIITGASRGIGKGIAKVFAEHGANVAFTYSSSVEAANALEIELNALGVKAVGYQSNAANFDEAQKLADAVHAEFGSIDVLINNAGITKDNLLMRMSEGDFDKVAKAAKLQTNPSIKVKIMDETFGILGNQRQIVRWAFEGETKIGDVKRFEVPNVGNVIAKVKAVFEAGLTPIADARPMVEPILKNKKKAEFEDEKIIFLPDDERTSFIYVCKEFRNKRITRNIINNVEQFPHSNLLNEDQLIPYNSETGKFEIIAETIKEIVGFKGHFVFNSNKPAYLFLFKNNEWSLYESLTAL